MNGGNDFDVLSLLTNLLLSDSNIYVFNYRYYKQIFGTHMGSKISPLLFNFVLDDLMSYCLEKI